LKALLESEDEMDELEEEIGVYWDCAYREGHLQRPDGDNANAILHRIREAAKTLVLAEREACKQACNDEKVGEASESDAAYNMALDHAVAAIDARSNAGGNQPQPPI
jgi:hypothetical protein